jgi:glycosyltransferase involved in cell wall biosynthesis
MKIEQHSPIKTAFFHIMAGNFSGAGKNIFRLLRRIDPAKLEPMLVGQTENELTSRVRDLGIKVFIVPYPPALDVYGQKLLKLKIRVFFRTFRGIWKYNLSLLSFFKEIKPQVIWADNIRTFFFIYAASKLSGCKVIWNIWSEPKGKVAWFLHRLCLILADVVNLEYHSQAQKLFGALAYSSFFQKKIVTLYTGVTDFEEASGSNICDELNLSSTDILILMASNISPAKGQLDLISAMEKLVKKFPNLHLLLAGQPLETHPDSMSYDSSLKQYANKKKLSHNVHFLGWRPDIRDLMQVTDIYVSTSYSESFPDAVREAMLVGKPVVVTNVGGTFELVKVGKSGFLFEPGDVHSLIVYLGRLIHNPKLRDSMGAEGKRIIEENFSTKVYAQNFEDMVSALRNL